MRYWWVLPLVGVLIAAPWIWSGITRSAPHRQPLPGYITDAAALRQEYLRYQGKPLEDPHIEQNFQHATDLMLEGNYASAAIMLETTAKDAALPVVFNNLGLLYVKLDDGVHAVTAFRDALARDLQYQPVRANLNRLKFYEAADPVTREVEPNGSNRQANVMALGRSVDGDISADAADLDCYRFTSPPAPRDVLAIELANRSRTLAPRIRVYDSDSRLADWSKESDTPGASLRELLSPPPNTTYYLHVDGLLGTIGAYSLTISALHAFDAYEPNDEITRATHVSLGQTIDANIMDDDDTDFYSFAGPASGTVTIEIRNRSKTLIPAVMTFNSEMRNTGFGPDLRTPGADLHLTMKAESGKTHYIQVWGQGNTAGDYSLTVK